jgi:hypothetical protein
VATIAAVGDDAGEGGANLCLDLRDHGCASVCPSLGLPGSALAWAMNWPLFERLSVVASETLTPNL